MIIVDNINEVIGKVICEHPYVKILTKPKLELYEGLPGQVFERWEAVAQVNETLAIVSLSVKSLSNEPPRSN